MSTVEGVSSNIGNIIMAYSSLHIIIKTITKKKNYES